jgi:hypothetical protein
VIKVPGGHKPAIPRRPASLSPNAERAGGPEDGRCRGRELARPAIGATTPYRRTMKLTYATWGIQAASHVKSGHSARAGHRRTFRQEIS